MPGVAREKSVGQGKARRQGQAPGPLVARLFGRIELSVGERVLPDEVWTRRSARSLLLLLLATPGHALPRDRVIDLLWPDASIEAGRNALYVALHTLRRVLEPDLVAGRASAYVDVTTEMVRLRPEPGSRVDVDRFESELARARNAAREERRPALREAVAWYRGDLLTEEPYADWPVARREGLRQAWERAVLDLAALDVAAGEPLATLEALEALVATDPTLEEAQRALIGAYAAAGQLDRARRQYERCVKALREQLDVGPSAATAALLASLQDTPVAAAPVTKRQRFRSLPAPPTQLIGRDAELERIQDLLWDGNVRLVTLTGPGGIGKTHLALTAGRTAAVDHADGAVFVSLATLRAPGLVLPAIAEAFGLRDDGRESLQDRLIETIRDLELLCLIDNFEPVIEAAPAVAEVLAAAPGLKVLATSRERLRLRGEHEVEVPPLPTLSPARLPSAAVTARNDAVKLFAERVREVRPAFAVTEVNAAAVAGICARLEGIPLAIELAAAWGRDLEPAELLSRLERRLDLLVEGPRDLPVRLQTMRAAIAWSYDLLPPGAQALFRRVAVFVGGFTAEHANEVNRGVENVEESTSDASLLLASLVDKNLAQRREDGRYAMLETVREFGLEELERSGDAPAVRRAHNEVMLGLVSGAVDAGRLRVTAQPLEVLEAEYDNLRAAIDASLAGGDREVALEIVTALRPLWRTRGHRAEAWDWMRRAMAASEGKGPRVRARALAAAGSLAMDRGDSVDAARSLGEAHDIYVELGEQFGIASTAYELSMLAHRQGDFAKQNALCEQVREIADAIGDRRLLHSALNGLGHAANGRGDFAAACAAWQESLEMIEEGDDPEYEVMTLANLTGALANLGDVDATIAYGERALRLARQLDYRGAVSWVLVFLANGYLLRGDLLRARALADEGREAATEMDDPHALINALSTAAEVAWATGEPARAISLVRDGLRLSQTAGLSVYASELIELIVGRVLPSMERSERVRLLAAADARRHDHDFGRTLHQESEFARITGELRSAMGTRDFERAWTAGRSIPLEQLIDDVIALTPA